MPHKNPETKRECRRKYYEAHREEERECGRVYRAAHREEDRERTRKWREANPEKHREHQRKYRAAHRGEQREYARKYAKAHPEVKRANRRCRRARKRGIATESFTDTDIFERDGWVCGICGQKINRRLKYPHPRSASLDHIVPLARGGGHTRINVQAAHLRCNVGKHAGDGGQLRLTD